MNKILLTLFMATTWTFGLNAQGILNMEMVGHLPFDNDASDVWGYVDGDGREYAIVGLNTYTTVVSLEDPANPVELVRIPGARSIWRDMKSFGDYVYVVADQGMDGVLIIDMSGAPASITWEFWRPQIDTLGISNTIDRCHNLYIDEAGYVYLSGCNIDGGGVVILDAASAPGQLSLVGVCDPRYSHDNFSRGDTVWSGDINNGVFSVIDVSDKGKPVTLATQATSRNFAHNTWLSDDGKYLFTTDERPDANVDAYDVSDLDNIRRLDTYRPKANEQRGVIPHNTHYYKGYLVTSWYTDGVIITDVHKPDNMVEVGYYDTYPGADGGYNGAWGAYPFLPSGLVLVSDIQTGLYVLQPQYERAAYLEGNITDAQSGDPVVGATLMIESPLFSPINSNILGEYKTGLAVPGRFTVSVTHPEYLTGSATVEISRGVVTIQDFELTPKMKVTLGGNVQEEGTNIPVANAHVIVENGDLRFEALTDDNGTFQVEMLEGEYNVYIAAWGYLHVSVEAQSFTSDERRVFQIPAGYQDDFFADLGWEVTGTATSGIWERDIPEGTQLGPVTANPDRDAETDLGDYAYVTGNDGQGEAGRDDIDNGYTILSSPTMALSKYREPLLLFSYWYVVGSGRTAPNDTLEIYLTNGMGDTATILKTGDLSAHWTPSPKYVIGDLIQLTDQVQLHIKAADDVAEGHVVEAGFDQFLVTEGSPNATSDLLSADLFEVMPNPVSEGFFIRLGEKEAKGSWTYEIMDNFGRKISAGKWVGNNYMIPAGELTAGRYYIRLISDKGVSAARTIIKTD